MSGYGYTGPGGFFGIPPSDLTRRDPGVPESERRQKENDEIQKRSIAKIKSGFQCENEIIVKKM